MDMDGFEYVKDGKGVIFETAYVFHISSCTLKSCFCKHYSSGSYSEKEEFFSNSKSIKQKEQQL